MDALRPLGSSPRNQWKVDESEVEFVRERRQPVTATLDATPQKITCDLTRTALVIVDMQNDFCHPDGWLGSIGVDVAPLAAPVEPLRALLPLCRANDIPVIWVNWGNRPDRLNLGPSTLHVYDGAGLGGGLGAPLANGARVLEAGSWAAAVIDALGDTGEDIHVPKFSMSGFWETHLDSILRNLDVTTLFFAGVNLDQCVLCTLQDASFRGYDAVLLEDCAATSSPPFCAEASLYNIRQCFGFVSDSRQLASRLRAPA